MAKYRFHFSKEDIKPKLITAPLDDKPSKQSRIEKLTAISHALKDDNLLPPRKVSHFDQLEMSRNQKSPSARHSAKNEDLTGQAESMTAKPGSSGKHDGENQGSMSNLSSTKNKVLKPS